MSRLPPTPATIKQLFALSGNLCAFPGCNQQIIQDGMVVGQICHIEAAELGGERFNPNQTDEERRSFDNLILLCSIHHTITNDVVKYPVEVLQKMKADHEGKFLHNPFEVSDDIVQKAINHYISIYTNVNTGNGTQIITYNINQGPNSKEISDLFETLFNANFPKLQQEAENIARSNIEEFKRNFLDKANYRLSPDDMSSFSSPDVQFILNKSIETIARKDSKDLRDSLSQLLIERVKNNDNDLLSIIINECIMTISKLTKNQLKMMAVCFVFCEYIRYKNIDSWSSLNNYFNHYVDKFLDFNYTYADAQHILYTGCASATTIINYETLSDLLDLIFPFLFMNPINIWKARHLGLSEKILSSMIARTDKEFRFTFYSEDKLKKHMHMIKLDESFEEPIMGLFRSSKVTDYSDRSKPATALLINKLDIGYKAMNKWEKGGLPYMRLNSVGLVIAAIYCSQVLGEEIDISVVLSGSSVQ
jgi:hypothetical protein